MLISKFKIINLCLGLLVSLFLFFNIQSWHLIWLGVFLSLIYFYLSGRAWGNYLVKILQINTWFKFFLGVLMSLILIATGGATAVVFYKITPIWLLIILILNLILAECLNYKNNLSQVKVKLPALEPVFKFKIWGYVVLFLSLIIYIFLLWQARTGNFILNPWGVIASISLYFYLIIVLICGWWLLSCKKITTAILGLILFSLIIHAVVPIVYQVGFGGDRWRHIAAEKYLQQGQIYEPALFGVDEISYSNLGPFKIPSVLVVGNKTSYSSFWSIKLILSWLLQIDIFNIDLWFGILIWSLFVPILFFILGDYFFENKRYNLLLTLISSCFYIFIFYGYCSLPVAYGFVAFLLCLILWLNYFKNKNKLNLYLAIFLSLLLYLNYILYLVLILIIVAWLFVFKYRPANLNLKWRVLMILILTVSVLILPILDVLSGFTNFKMGLNFNYIIKSGGDMLARMLGWGQLTFLNLDITSTSFIYNQTNENLTTNTLLNFKWWPALISLLMWLTIIWGWRKFKIKSWGRGVGWLLIIFLIDHYVSWYLMEGSRLFVKRLDLFIAFLMLILLCRGVYELIFNKFLKLDLKYKTVLILLILSLSVTSVLASGPGPMEQIVTRDELKAAEYVYRDIQLKNNLNDRECVLANTWPLLALEMVSARKITAGGFPVYKEYSQPERVRLFKGMLRQPSIRYIYQAMDITQTQGCYFMTEERWWQTGDKVAMLENLIQIFGQPIKKIGEVYIFYYTF
ncbi:MAG: hypothetical protein PHS07_03835 [Patescibacteria group bacterium]|nr:hypothetical protein [Patescibacteria group bacterium]